MPAYPTFGPPQYERIAMRAASPDHLGDLEARRQATNADTARLIQDGSNRLLELLSNMQGLANTPPEAYRPLPPRDGASLYRPTYPAPGQTRQFTGLTDLDGSTNQLVNLLRNYFPRSTGGDYGGA